MCTFYGVTAMTLGVCVLLAPGFGCSSSGRMEESKQAVESYSSLKTSLRKGQVQVDEAIKALDGLQSGQDLEKAFKAFDNEVSKTEAAGRNATKRATAMRGRSNEYIKKWQSEMEKLEDPTIKASLAARREAVRTNFEQVKSAADATRAAYDPFLATLKEVRTALSIDLSPAAVKGLKPAIDQAKTQGRSLKDGIGALQAELDRIQAGLSPTGAPAAGG